MLIRLTIKREGGSVIEVGTERYFFTPNEQGDHVAEVTDFAHIQRLLMIEGYEPYGEAAVAENAKIEAEVNTLEPVEELVVPELTAYGNMTFEELREEYNRLFGRLAPPQIKYDTLVRKLTAARLPKLPGSVTAAE